jgi:hypothetical protein
VASRAWAGHFRIDGENRLPHLVNAGSQEPPSLPLEWRAKVARTEAESWRDSVAHCSKVAVGLGESGKSDVFRENESRTAFANDASHLGPEVSRIGDTESLAGLAPRLAWEAAADDIDLAAPGCPVKRLDVTMNRERLKDSFGLSGTQHLLAVGIDLDGTDAAVA